MTPHDSAPLQIGQNMGRYRIEALLGAGGMGVVYLAHDDELRRRVAIKLIDSRRRDRRSSRLLLEEARVTASLNHPAICGVHEVGLLGDDPYIVLEHVDGTPLSDLIPRDRGLNVETAIHYAIDIVDGIAHAHARGVVHGDLKSSNVMIERGGRVRILDFGLAVHRTVATGSDSLETTRPCTVLSGAGTVPYMAPELLSGRSADPRSDVWAIGVVIFEMLAGCRPFRGGTTYELAAAILNGRPAPLPPRVPRTLRRIVRKCLCGDPVSRFVTARDLAVALDDVA
jgi:serine/threonine protein kinase